MSRLQLVSADEHFEFRITPSFIQQIELNAKKEMQQQAHGTTL